MSKSFFYLFALIGLCYSSQPCLARAQTYIECVRPCHQEARALVKAGKYKTADAQKYKACQDRCQQLCSTCKAPSPQTDM